MVSVVVVLIKYIYSSIVLKSNIEVLVAYLSISMLCYFLLLLHYKFLIPLVTLQMWMNDVKYNQVLNQTLVPPGVNAQATLQYTKSFKLAAPLPALRTLS